MPFLPLFLALLSSVAPSFFLGGQSAFSSPGGISPQVVAGVQAGRWDAWISVDPDWRFHQQPFDTLHRASGWGDGYGSVDIRHCVRVGADRGARDSGTGQTWGAQLVVLKIDQEGMRGPSQYTSIDLLWGIRWRGDGLEAGGSIGPSFTMIHPRDYDFRLILAPVLNLRLAKIW